MYKVGHLDLLAGKERVEGRQNVADISNCGM